MSLGGGTLYKFGVLIRGDLRYDSGHVSEPNYLLFGKLVGWGDNRYGQVGTLWGLQINPTTGLPNNPNCTYNAITGDCYIATSECREHPELCVAPPQFMPPLRKVSAGWDHVLALAMYPELEPDGTYGLIAWGQNVFG